MTFQEVKGLRRAILSVGESTEAGNSFWFGQEESATLPIGSAEQQKIREIVRQAQGKLPIRRDRRRVFKLDAWADAPKKAIMNRFSKR